MSCQEENSYAVDILGKWQVHEWSVPSTQKQISKQMNFTFQDDARYSVDYGSASEKGKYWFRGDKLFTHEDGKADKKVLIQLLTSDTLKIEMNRAGTIEEVVLIRPE